MNTIKLSSPATREFWEIPILFEDEHLLVLDKPAGLPASPDRLDPERPYLAGLLHDAIGAQKPWVTQKGIDYLRPAQRLDAEASGILVFARTKAALVALAELFGSEKPVQLCFALIAGEPSSEHFEMKAKIAPDAFRPGVMRIDPKAGKKSLSVFDVVEKFSGYTVLRGRAVTQRPQQLRVHLKHAGFPLVGDKLFGGKPLWLSRLKKNYRLKPGREERPLVARVALHVQELTLPHPITGNSLTIISPLPKDLRVALRYLREFRGIAGAGAGFENAD